MGLDDEFALKRVVRTLAQMYKICFKGQHGFEIHVTVRDQVRSEGM